MPRGLDGDRDEAPEAGRFGTLFPGRPACEAGPRAIESLVTVMTALGERDPAQNLDIPAGFTYLGQFIDHDLTFDPTRFDAARRDPRALVDFRTPRFDLDSLYGLGPDVQPYLYDLGADPPGTRLLTGANADDGTPDLPRNGQHVALIGDPRNDENQIVSQLHLLFIRFHNAVVDHLVADGVRGDELLPRARGIVRRHYQWIVYHQFLTKVVGQSMAKQVRARRKVFRPGRRPFIPVEFSGAAYRFGHSMVRDLYGLKRLPAPPGTHPVALSDMFGRKPLTADRVIDWERFFDLATPKGPQPSFAIDRVLSPAMFALPDGGEAVLARRNLVRGRKLGLPSGQDVAAALGAEPLTPHELDIPAGADRRDVLLRSTPLWYYVLAEAEQRAGGAHLGPVGGQIVGEVLVGLLHADPDSYLNTEPRWTPGELGTGDKFTMAELIGFARDAEP